MVTHPSTNRAQCRLTQRANHYTTSPPESNEVIPASGHWQRNLYCNIDCTAVGWNLWAQSQT